MPPSFCLVLSLLVGLLGQAHGFSAVVHDNETAFVSALGASERFQNDFSDLPPMEWYAHPLRYSSIEFAYEIISNPLLMIFSRVACVSTVETNAAIVVSITTTNVRAVGASFYLADMNNTQMVGTMALEVSDGTSNQLSVAAGPVPAFVGFVSHRSRLTELRVRSFTPGAYPVMDNLYVAEGMPVLSITQTTTNTVSVTWPAPALGYQLETAPEVLPANWVTITNSPQNVGELKEVIFPLSAERTFYRLRKH